MGATPEGKVKAKVRHIIITFPQIAHFMPGMGAYGVVGVHDFILCVAGRFVTIETKATERDKMTPLQERFMKKVQAAGGISLLIHAGNVDTLYNTFSRIINGNYQD